MGRTRPKKLTSKAAIPIIRETDIDVIEDEIQSSLQQIETGVEKAEESVSVPTPVMSRDARLQPIVKILYTALYGSNARLLTRLFVGIPSASRHKCIGPGKNKRCPYPHSRDHPQ